MCDLFGGGGTTETTQQTQYAPWISQAQQSALGMALAQNLPDLSRSGQYSHAGFNMDQQKGFDLVRDAVGDYSRGGRTMVPASAYSQGMRPSTMDAATSQAAQAGQVQLDPNEYEAFFSPYKSTVIDTALNNMRRERDNNNASVSAQAAARGAFGGSGEALGIAQNNRNFASDAGQLSAQLMDQGFNAAQALASGNADRRQQTELSNAGFTQQTNLSNAANQQQANLQNAMWEMEAGRNNMDNAYRMLNLEDQFKNTDLQRQMQLINALLGTGAFQQNDMQDQLNAPYDALARLFQYVPQIYESTTTGTQPDNSPSLFQQLMGAGLAIGGMGTKGGGSVLGDWLVGSKAL